MAVLHLHFHKGFCLVAESRGYYLAVVCGVSHCSGFFCCRAWALGLMGFVMCHVACSCSPGGFYSAGSVIVAHRLSCSTTCGIFPWSKTEAMSLSLAGGFLVTWATRVLQQLRKNWLSVTVNFICPPVHTVSKYLVKHYSRCVWRCFWMRLASELVDWVKRLSVSKEDGLPSYPF